MLKNLLDLKIDKNTKDVFLGIVNSQAFLAVILAICISQTMNGVTQRMDQMVLLIESIKSEHDVTPRLLAEIREKITEMCGQCYKCQQRHSKTEVDGGHG